MNIAQQLNDAYDLEKIKVTFSEIEFEISRAHQAGIFVGYDSHLYFIPEKHTDELTYEGALNKLITNPAYRAERLTNG